MTTTCLDCGRPLDHPDSIARERGRVCQEKFEGDTHVTPVPRRMRRKKLPEDQVLTDFPDLTVQKGQGRVITIYGASDDLIEIDGDIREEIPCADTGEDGVLIAASNGVVLRIEFGTCWRLFPLTNAHLVSIVPCPEDDEDNYSDVATLTGDVTWIVCRDQFVKA